MKDFDRWNTLKKEIDNLDGKRYHPKEVWWCSWGLNVGFEQDGNGELYQRPALILKPSSRNTCFVIPLTKSSSRDRNRLDVGIVDKKNATAILSQMRVMDTRRFTERMCILDKERFDLIKKAIRDYI
ncbi:MAG: mRNA interferase MazF [Candidatus Paceibacteria bacterium]|jgi:mRNA interferase MazF